MEHIIGQDHNNGRFLNQAILKMAMRMFTKIRTIKSIYKASNKISVIFYKLFKYNLSILSYLKANLIATTIFPGIIMIFNIGSLIES